MKQYICYDSATGRIIGDVSTPISIDTDTLFDGGYRYISGCAGVNTHVIDGVPVYSPSPKLQLLNIRIQRDVLMLGTDKYMLPDFPIGEEVRQAYVAYRQLLRDFPASCDPQNPIWPVPPC